MGPRFRLVGGLGVEESYSVALLASISYSPEE